MTAQQSAARPALWSRVRSIAITALGAVVGFISLTIAGPLLGHVGLNGMALRTAFAAAFVVLIAGHVQSRVRSAIWTLPYFAALLPFALFPESLNSSSAISALVGTGVVAYAVGVAVRPRMATLLAVPLAALAYVVQANADGLASKSVSAAVPLAALEIEEDGQTSTLFSAVSPNTVFEFWNETCAPCIRNLRDLGAYREDYQIVPVYVSFFESEPQDANDYVDYRIERQAVLRSDPDTSGIRGVPLAAVVDEDREVCFQGVLRDEPLDFVGGIAYVLNVRC